MLTHTRGAIALVVLVSLAGCPPTSDGGDDAAASDGAADTETAPLPDRTCNATTNGCQCVAGQPQAGDLAACDTTSIVKSSGEVGVCCQGAAACHCDAFMCKDSSAPAACICGTTYAIDTTIVGTVVSACSASGGRHCCRNATVGTCTCSQQACLSNETDVAGCSAFDFAVCGAGESSAPSCK